jgi:hypothetical protein
MCDTRGNAEMVRRYHTKQPMKDPYETELSKHRYIAHNSSSVPECDNTQPEGETKGKLQHQEKL